MISRDTSKSGGTEAHQASRRRSLVHELTSIDYTHSDIPILGKFVFFMINPHSGKNQHTLNAFQRKPCKRPMTNLAGSFFSLS
jgi:hypothetical protein